MIRSAADRRDRRTVNARETDLIIIAGHSHVRSLIGYGDGRAEGTYVLPVEGYDNIYGLHSPWPRPQDYWPTLMRHAPGNSVVVLWEGNRHNEFFLIEQQPPFDFVPRQLQSLPVQQNAHIVPEALVRRKFQYYLGNLLADLCSALKAHGARRVVVLGTPPPKRDLAGFRALLPAELPFLNHPAGTTEEQLTLTSPLVRLKLWHVMQEVHREQAESVGAEFFPVPEITTDETGFLKPEFWWTDLTHANESYGRVMVECLAERFSGVPATGESLLGAAVPGR
jgi:hypothetical protein